MDGVGWLGKEVGRLGRDKVLVVVEVVEDRGEGKDDLGMCVKGVFVELERRGEDGGGVDVGDLGIGIGEGGRGVGEDGVMLGKGLERVVDIVEG